MRNATFTALLFTALQGSGGFNWIRTNDPYHVKVVL